MGRYLSREEIENEIDKSMKSIMRFLFGLATGLLLIIITVAIVRADSVTLAWDANDPAPEGYVVFQRLAGESYIYDDGAEVCKTAETTCVVDNLSQGIQYYFVARAYVGQEQSGDSNEVNFMPIITPPANLRINMEISVYIDENGRPIVAMAPIMQKVE